MAEHLRGHVEVGSRLSGEGGGCARLQTPRQPHVCHTGMASAICRQGIGFRSPIWDSAIWTKALLVPNLGVPKDTGKFLRTAIVVHYALRVLLSSFMDGVISSLPHSEWVMLLAREDISPVYLYPGHACRHLGACERTARREIWFLEVPRTLRPMIVT